MAGRLNLAGTILVMATRFVQATGVAATNTADEALELRPPLPEIPPGFWEMNGTWVAGAAVLVLCGVAALIVLLRRPRPAIQIPPVVRAREELAALREEAETGATLSRVSHTVRWYLQTVFHLGAGEMTTTEVKRALQEQPEVGPDLARAAGTFLSDCDERKFAPTPPPSSVRVLDTALGIIDMAENRLASQPQAPPPVQSGPNGQSATLKPAA